MIEFTDRNGHAWFVQVKRQPDWIGTSEAGTDELLRLLEFVPDSEFICEPVSSRWQPEWHSKT